MVGSKFHHSFCNRILCTLFPFWYSEHCCICFVFFSVPFHCAEQLYAVCCTFVSASIVCCLWELLLYLLDHVFVLFYRFLTYCPAKRITAEDGLKHEYFRETPLPIDPSVFPTWPAKSEQQRVKRGTSPRPPEGGLGYTQLVSLTIIMDTQRLIL